MLQELSVQETLSATALDFRIVGTPASWHNVKALADYSTCVSGVNPA